MKVPNVIYLQYHGDEPVTRYDEDDNLVTIPEDELGEVDADEVTWCVDRIYDGDIEYVRADRYRDAVDLLARTHTEPVTARWHADARAFLVEEDRGAGGT